MKLETQTTFRGVESSDALRAFVEEEAAKLDRFFDGIMSCRVLVERAHEHQRSDPPLHVRIELHVPGAEIVVKHQPSTEPGPTSDEDVSSGLARAERYDAPYKDALLAIRAAFRKAGRRLQDYARVKHGDVKVHEPTATGRITQLLGEYGFVRTPEGRDVYFHRNSVLGGDFDRLHVGETVRFVEEQGENGAQASTIYL